MTKFPNSKTKRYLKSAIGWNIFTLKIVNFILLIFLFLFILKFLKPFLAGSSSSFLTWLAIGVPLVTIISISVIFLIKSVKK